MRQIAQELAPTPSPGHVGEITAELYTVVCREGRAVDALTEWLFMEAWRFSNHLTSAIAADVYVVTPHGWTGILDSRAGFEPRLASRLLTAVPVDTDPTLDRHVS